MPQPHLRYSTWFHTPPESKQVLIQADTLEELSEKARGLPRSLICLLDDADMDVFDAIHRRNNPGIRSVFEVYVLDPALIKPVKVQVNDLSAIPALPLLSRIRLMTYDHEKLLYADDFDHTQDYVRALAVRHGIDW